MQLSSREASAAKTSLCDLRESTMPEAMRDLWIVVAGIRDKIEITFKVIEITFKVDKIIFFID